jgi:hypothetical protein
MADETGARPPLSPFVLLLAALLVGALLLGMFLCTRPADDRVLENDNETEIAE